MRKETIGDLMRLTILFDFYGVLLRPQYKECVESYLDEDLSMPEIAENLGVSRQYIHSILNKALLELEEADDKLGLIDRYRTNRQSKQDLKKALEGLQPHLDAEGGRALKNIKDMLENIESGGPYGV